MQKIFIESTDGSIEVAMKGVAISARKTHALRLRLPLESSFTQCGVRIDQQNWQRDEDDYCVITCGNCSDDEEIRENVPGETTRIKRRAGLKSTGTIKGYRFEVQDSQDFYAAVDDVDLILERNPSLLKFPGYTAAIAEIDNPGFFEEDASPEYVAEILLQKRVTPLLTYDKDWLGENGDERASVVFEVNWIEHS